MVSAPMVVPVIAFVEVLGMRVLMIVVVRVIMVLADALRPAEPREVAVRTSVWVDVDERAVPVKRSRVRAAHAGLRRRTRQIPLPAAASAAPRIATVFVVTHVRQALQQAVAIGAFSPYLATTRLIRTVAICFTLEG
jgi:hypothetical protein